MSERLIVIGGGGAGTAAATIAKRVNPSMKVTLFTEFPDIAYSPCGIPFVHGREIDKFENLFLSTVERYVEDGLDMRMETTVTDIDLDRGTVTARNGHEGFDKLVVCTGFTWEKPDVPGANLEGLHYVKDIRAAMLFDEQLDGMKRVAVIGATPLGVEMAGNLGHRGLQVDFIDEGPVGAVRGARSRCRRARPRVAGQPRRDAAVRHARRGLRREGRPRRGRRHVGRRARVRRGDRLPAQAPEQRARRGGRRQHRHDRRDRGRRADADQQAGGVGGGRRRRGPARPVDAPDPRAHRLACLRPGPHRRVQRRGPRPRLRPGVDAVGDGRRRLHDRRLLGRRDAGERDGHAVRGREGRRRLARPLLPGRDAHARQAARRAGHAQAHRRPDPRRRGRQGARGLPRVRRQARRHAGGHRVDGEHLLAADRRAVRADGDRGAERARHSWHERARRTPSAGCASGPSTT